jgi:drug/metabolite transporter (DMT)-like permease
MPYLLLILTTLFWSGNFVLSRGMHTDIPPLALSFWRWVLALAILLVFSWRSVFRDRQALLLNRRFITVQGLLGVTSFNSLIYLAVQTTTAVNVVLINSCVPILIALCSLAIYRERLSVRQWIGILTSLSGVALIMAGGDSGSLLDMEFNKGGLLVLLAGVSWALYSINVRNYPSGLHPFAFQTGIMVVGVIGILPMYLVELLLGYRMEFTAPAIATIGYVAVFPSVLAFIFWNRAVRDIGANRAGIFIHLMPVFSSILAVVFLNETIEVYHLQGISLVFLGIFLATFRAGANT